MTKIRFRPPSGTFGRPFPGVALVSLLLVACGGAQQERARVAEIQREAEHRIEVIRVESEKRAGEAQREIAKLKAELAAKNEELDRALRGRSEGDHGAHDEFAAKRRALEDHGRTVLGRLDEEAQDIGRRTRALASAARAEIEAELAKAGASRKYVEDDLHELDDATRQTFGELSGRLERHLGELEQTLKNARRKLK